LLALLSDYFVCRTQHTPTLLTPAILSRAKKRSYVPYEFKRTPDIWLNRADLIAFEEALSLEARVDELLDGYPAASAPAKRGRPAKSVTPAVNQTPARRVATQTPLKTPASVYETPTKGGEDGDGTMELNQRQQAAWEVIQLVNEILPTWRDLVCVKGEVGPRPGGLERFEAGRYPHIRVFDLAEHRY
jgi:fanconi-associated nuclease 1